MLAKKFDSAVYEQCAEDIRDPMKPSNQANAHHNENGAHDQRTNDAPEQYFVLVLGCDAEETENQNEDEEVIDAKRKFNHVTGNELH